MQKLNNPCIKISTFAELCNTNKRTLIHYDEIGLFSPAYTDEKGYRYYSESQCDVFFTITCLKDLGMPLKEIKTYIDHRSPDRLRELLLHQQEQIRKEMDHLNRIRKVIETKLSLVSAGTGVQFHDRCSDVMLEHCPEELLIVSPKLNTSNQKQLFSALSEHIRYCTEHALSTGHPYGAILPVHTLSENGPDVYAYFFTKISRPASQSEADFASPARIFDHPHLCKPAGIYAVIYLKGDYYASEEAYRKLLDYLEEHNMTAGEFCYKEAVWDELTVQSADDYITKISIPLAKDS